MDRKSRSEIHDDVFYSDKTILRRIRIRLADEGSHKRRKEEIEHAIRNLQNGENYQAWVAL